MEHTRASIRDTVEDLRGKVRDTLDWRQYVNRHPTASLSVAVGLGLVLGRALGGLVQGTGRDDEVEPYAYGAYRGAESYGESGVTTTAPRAAQSAYEAAEPALSGTRRVVGQSVSRLGSRAENILNRLIDELTDAVETTLVPALTSRFRGLIDLEGRSARRRSGSGSVGRQGFVQEPVREGESGRRWDKPVHEEASGIYPGTPAEGRSAQST